MSISSKIRRGSRVPKRVSIAPSDEETDAILIRRREGEKLGLHLKQVDTEVRVISINPGTAASRLGIGAGVLGRSVRRCCGKPISSGPEVAAACDGILDVVIEFSKQPERPLPYCSTEGCMQIRQPALSLMATPLCTECHQRAVLHQNLARVEEEEAAVRQQLQAEEQQALFDSLTHANDAATNQSMVEAQAAAYADQTGREERNTREAVARSEEIGWALLLRNERAARMALRMPMPSPGAVLRCAIPGCGWEQVHGALCDKHAPRCKAPGCDRILAPKEVVMSSRGYCFGHSLTGDPRLSRHLDVQLATPVYYQEPPSYHQYEEEEEQRMEMLSQSELWTGHEGMDFRLQHQPPKPPRPLPKVTPKAPVLSTPPAPEARRRVLSPHQRRAKYTPPPSSGIPRRERNPNQQVTFAAPDSAPFAKYLTVPGEGKPRGSPRRRRGGPRSRALTSLGAEHVPADEREKAASPVSIEDLPFTKPAPSWVRATDRQRVAERQDFPEQVQRPFLTAQFRPEQGVAVSAPRPVIPKSRDKSLAESLFSGWGLQPESSQGGASGMSFEGGFSSVDFNFGGSPPGASGATSWGASGVEPADFGFEDTGVQPGDFEFDSTGQPGEFEGGVVGGDDFVFASTGVDATDFEFVESAPGVIDSADFGFDADEPPDVGFVL
eukprot:Hpha_TRINITY_DN12692_c0_g1::TRINITY_DN12692_c0_g1_i1::g.49635::m.49635